MLRVHEVLGSGLHIGKLKKSNYYQAERYIIGYRRAVSIFDAGATTYFAARAENFVRKCIQLRSRGFFFGLSELERRSIQLLALMGQIVSGGEWYGGFLTNIRRFPERIINFHKVPHFVVCFRFNLENYSVLREKVRSKVPLIAPVDSDSSTSWLEYPIPGNSNGQGGSWLLHFVFSRAVFGGIGTRLLRLKGRMKHRREIKKSRSAARLVNRQDTKFKRYTKRKDMAQRRRFASYIALKRFRLKKSKYNMRRRFRYLRYLSRKYKYYVRRFARKLKKKMKKAKLSFKVHGKRKKRWKVLQKNGGKRNRTAAVGFSGLNSTIELSPRKYIKKKKKKRTATYYIKKRGIVSIKRLNDSL